MDIFEHIDQEEKRDDVPDFSPGDTVKLLIKSGDSGRRAQPFEGIVISRRGSGSQETFTVRKISHGVGVERTFPVHSPSLEKIEVLKRGDVNRAKLFYLRERKGKKARVREKRGPRPVQGEEVSEEPAGSAEEIEKSAAVAEKAEKAEKTDAEPAEDSEEDSE